MSTRTRFPTLWLCADFASASPDTWLRVIDAVANTHRVTVWLRPERTSTASAIASMVRRARSVVHATAGQVFVGDRIDVAIAEGADGVHLGTQSITPRDAREVLSRASSSLAISAAVHDPHTTREAAIDADALILSPLFAVPGKGHRMGVGAFAVARATAPGRAVIALGGIENAAGATAAAIAGATGIAVRRALLQAHDPSRMCQQLLTAFAAALDPHPRV